MAASECLQYARDYLARYPKTTYELNKKLQEKWFPPEEIWAAIAKLTQASILNDALYAELYLTSEVGRKGKPLNKIIQKLRAKGIAKDILDAACEAWTDDLRWGELQKIVREIEKLRAKGKDDISLTKTLMTRGYWYSQIKEALHPDDENND